MTTDNTTAAPEVKAEAAPEQVRLTLEDLNVLAGVVKVAQSRGAFQAEEMSQVGAIYDKLNYFLTQASEAQKAAEAQQAETAEQEKV